MTEQDEILHSIAIEKAIKDLGITRVIEMIDGICEKDLKEHFEKKDDFDEGEPTKE